METGFDGFFQFKYLTKGTYRVFAYSTMTNSQKVAVIDTVSVESGKTKNTRDIYIHEGKAYETSYIKGTVLARYYDKGFITGFIPAGDIRVFLRKKGAVYQMDDVKTGAEGEFVFQGMDPGDYEVIVMTEINGEKVLKPVIKSVTVKKKGVFVTIQETFDIIINA